MSKRRFNILKSIFEKINLYSGEGSPTSQPQYILIRKFFRFFGLYPYIHAKHFYVERSSSFMAPKIYEYTKMIGMTQLKDTDTILDVGCGEGTLTLTLAKKVRKAVGVDTASGSIADARIKAEELKNEVFVEFYDQAIEELNFEDGCFDKIFSFSVIEHIPNYQQVFEELYRLLKRGGELVISVDSYSSMEPELKAIHKDTFMVQQYFEKSDLHDLLSDLGFEKIEIVPIFKSSFAKRWCTRVLLDHNENFDFHKRFYSLLVYFKLVLFESRVKQKETGLFLLARCVK